MTEPEKFAALRERPLSDHTPFCNYGQTNGQLMCTCEVLVEIVEAYDEQEGQEDSGPSSSGHADHASGGGNRGSRSEQRARRLNAKRATAGGRKPHARASSSRSAPGERRDDPGEPSA